MRNKFTVHYAKHSLQYVLRVGLEKVTDGLVALVTEINL